MMFAAILISVIFIWTLSGIYNNPKYIKIYEDAVHES